MFTLGAMKALILLLGFGLSTVFAARTNCLLDMISQRPVNYFAYGSNMKLSVVSKRIGKYDIENMQPGVLSNYRLCFNIPGIPLVEPSFASISRRSGADVYGAIVTMPAPAFAALAASEGVPFAYRTRSVKVMNTLTGEYMEAKTFIGAQTFPLGLEVPPSRYYLDLLREGACEIGLSDRYCQYLRSIQPSPTIPINVRSLRGRD